MFCKEWVWNGSWICMCKWGNVRADIYDCSLDVFASCRKMVILYVACWNMSVPCRNPETCRRTQENDIFIHSTTIPTAHTWTSIILQTFAWFDLMGRHYSCFLIYFCGRKMWDYNLCILSDSLMRCLFAAQNGCCGRPVFQCCQRWMFRFARRKRCRKNYNFPHDNR